MALCLYIFFSLFRRITILTARIIYPLSMTGVWWKFSFCGFFNSSCIDYLMKTKIIVEIRYKVNERVEYELKFDMPLTHIFSRARLFVSLPWNDNFVATTQYSWNFILIYSSYMFYMVDMTFGMQGNCNVKILINFVIFKKN